MVDVAALVARACGSRVEWARPVPGGDICQAFRIGLGGETAFAKTNRCGSAMFDAEARSLAWLAEAGAPVPRILGVGDDVLVLSWVERGAPSPASAAGLGRALALVHAAGADEFGAPWPGFAGRLQLPNTSAESWPEFYAATRLLPLVARARDAGTFDSDVVERVAGRLASLAGPPEPPARLHGDLWSGNVLWGTDQAWLVDPASYGGHRETDLAMLDLFGAPHLDTILAAYAEVTPLADGWRERTGLHQLYPLLAHAVMFGGGYGARAAAVARRYA